MKFFKKTLCVILILAMFFNISFVVGAENDYSNEYFNAKNDKTLLRNFFEKHEKDYVVHETFISKKIDRLLSELDEINSSIKIEKLKFSSEIMNGLTDEEKILSPMKCFHRKAKRLF